VDVGLCFSLRYELYIKIDIDAIYIFIDVSQFCGSIMPSEEAWRWEFSGYESPAEGRVVQVWFNSLSVEAREEIADIFQSLQVVTNRRWKRPEFDSLDGAGGISEVRPASIRCDDGELTYRVYGYFGPNQREYTLLHGTLKPERNDRDGKRIARERMHRIARREATVHKFDFETGLN